MRTLRNPLLLIIIVFTMIFACQKDDDNNVNENPPEIGQIEIQVVLPVGSAIDYTTTSVFSLGNLNTVNSTGRSIVDVNGNNLELAALLDANGSPLLLGFVSNQRAFINTQTTADVLLYFSTTSGFLLTDFKDGFIQQLQSSAGYLEFVETLNTLFIDNSQMLSNETYIPALEEASNKLTIDLGEVAQRVITDTDEIKSGIRLNEVGESSVNFTNIGPRRSEAYFYQKGYTNLEGEEFTTNSDISGTDVADHNLQIPNALLNSALANGVVDQSFLSSLMSYCGGKLFTDQSSETLNLDLEDFQAAVTYEAAVIGPGQSGSLSSLTNAELEVYKELCRKTFVLDYLLPLSYEVFGRKKDLANLNHTFDEQLFAAIDPIISGNQALLNDLYDGEFSDAFTDYIPGSISGSGGSGDMFDLMLEAYDITNPESEFGPYNYLLTDELQNNASNIYKIVDRAMRTKGYNCMDERYDDAKVRDTWDVIIDEGLVKLEPRVGSVSNVGSQQVITAELIGEAANQTQVEYQWSTTSNYGGTFVDGNGNQGVTMTTSEPTINFISVVNNDQLSFIDNYETVTLTAVSTAGGNQEIGMATMEVNVRKTGFKLLPTDGVTQGNSTLELSLGAIGDGALNIPNDDFEYEIYWSTNGTYGALEGNSNYVTKLNEKLMDYRCTDTEVEEATETVSANIYARPSGSTAPFKLVDQVSTELTIRNEENVIYKTVPIDYDIWSDGADGYGYLVFFKFTPLDGPIERNGTTYEAVNYSLTITDHNPQPPSPFVGSSRFWNAGSTQNMDENGMYFLDTYYGSGPNTNLPNVTSFLGNMSGSAQLRINLEPVQ